MKLGDRAIGFLTALGGIALLQGSRDLGAPPGQPIGAGFFPSLIAIVLIVAGLALAALEQRRISQGADAAPLVRLPEWASSGGATFNVLLLLGAIGFFVYAVTPLGFVPTSALITFALSLRLGVRWPAALLTAVVLAVTFHLVFVKGLRVALPPGLLAGYI
ncbi:MAG: tripartite tricarboxylate transporter TctB family protein [Hyphomicrobiaceae bacterium]